MRFLTKWKQKALVSTVFLNNQERQGMRGVHCLSKKCKKKGAGVVMILGSVESRGEEVGVSCLWFKGEALFFYVKGSTAVVKD